MNQKVYKFDARMELLLQDSETPLSPSEWLEALNVLRCLIKDIDTLAARQLEETRNIVSAQRAQMEEFLDLLERRSPRE
jgi:hypothetical protein